MDRRWQELELRVGRRIPPSARNLFTKTFGNPPNPDDPHFEDYVDYLRDHVDFADRFYTASESRRKPRNTAEVSAYRHRALSEVLAVEAASVDAVREFQSDHLNDALLDWSDVESWIHRQVKLDGRPTTKITATWMTTRLRSRTVPRARPDELGHSVEMLAYAVPDDSWRRVIAVNESGVLGVLRRLSERLARSFSWQPSQATVFVLTGLTPQTTRVRITYQTMPPMADGYVQPWRMHITVEADLTVDPEEVAVAFRERRSEVLKLYGRRRARLLSTKSYALAIHVARRPETEAWRETMRRWDHAHPEWAYGGRADAVRQFRNEANRAIEKTLDPFGCAP